MALGIKDLVLTPIYLVFIYSFALIYRETFIKNKKLKKYFLPALTFKIVGAICLGLIYNYYYGSGDTINYFNDIKVIFELIYSDFQTAVQLFFLDTEKPNYDLSDYTHKLFFNKDSSSYIIVRVGTIFSLFTFGTYTLIAICFAVLSFIGVWALCVTLSKIYPNLTKEMAIATCFIPSVFFWGSGLMKDSLTLALLSLSFYAFFKIFIERKNIFMHTILLVLTLFIIKSIKIYIALCLIPALFIYLFLLFNHNIKSKSLRIFLRPILIAIGISFGYLLGSAFVQEDAKYNLNNLAVTAKITSEYINAVSQMEGGSAYSLGDYDPTIIGMLTKLPQGIWVTLFRPYLWESKNIIMSLSAFESFIFLCLTLWTLYKLGIKKIIFALKENPYVQFSLIFSLTFAFAVGVSTYNFGALVRYKIPMLPFYLSSILILKSYIKNKNGK